MAQKHMVTGAFGYSGQYIARRLLEQNEPVATLTNSPYRAHSLGSEIPVHPFRFDQPDELARSLEGVDVLYNTYWVRFNHRLFSHADAVANTRTLIAAAGRAGVRRIVHTSITNPSKDSHLEYFSGKAVLEETLAASGISYAILRPAVLFGPEDVLVNNIAWMLRRFPLFGLFGDGSYSLQPIHVDDFAALAVEHGRGTENTTIDAIGPETLTFRQLVELIGRAIGCPRPIVCIPPGLGLLFARMIGRVVGDVVLTRDEIQGLMANTLLTNSAPAGRTHLSTWLGANKDRVGRRYSNELNRRIDRRAAFRISEREREKRVPGT